MNKQDEEKAREIIRISNTKQVYDIVDFDSLEEALEEDLIEMARLKEEKTIEKAVEWLEPVFKDLAGYNRGGALIKDFKKYMEE